MNNKYDVNNFSKLIDTFKKENEVKLVQEDVELQIKQCRANSQFQLNQTIFDPVIPKDKDFEAAKKRAKYEFVQFKGKKYDLANLNHKLLASPPLRIIDYKHKDETINFVLDKCFMQVNMKSETLDAMHNCLMQSECRDFFLQMLEKDYQSYGLSHLKPQDIDKRNLRVLLPSNIFQNLLNVFMICIDQIKKDII